MRLVVGIGLVSHGVMTLAMGLSIKSAMVAVLASAAGLSLLVGFWTPIVGAIVAVLEFWQTISQSRDPWVNILLGTIGLALALIGPGALSIDARRFGWKRIDIRDRKP